MADNVPITDATSTSRDIATDEIAGKNYQLIKLADGTANSTEIITGTAANGLDVDPTRLPDVIPDIENTKANSVQYSVKWRAINAASTGNNTIVPAVSAKKIRVLSIFLTAASAVDIGIKSDVTTLVEAMSILGGTPFYAAPPLGYVCETVANKDLILSLSSGVQVSGFVNYVEI